MKKLICLLLVVVMTCTVLSGCEWSDLFNCMIIPSTTTATIDEIEWEEKIVWDGDVNSNFVIGELLVIIDRAISVPNKVYEPEFFVGVEVVKIIDQSSPIKDFENIPEDYNQRLYIVLAETYDTKEKTLEAMRILESVEGIKSVSPNLILNWDTTPNDIFFDNSIGIRDQWSLEKIEIEKVWDFSTGTSDLKVAVLDRGVSSHEDLDDNYDISNACDFYDATLEDPFFCKIDESGHGTHVAGIIGAKGNNNLGVCGINWDVSLVQMRVIGAETIYSFTNALEWAISDDIDIISMSASIYEPIPYAEDAIRDYCNQGGIFVCSTGNDEQDNDSYGQYNYPSYYGSNLYEDKIDNMISVGRVDWNDSRPDDANWGLETINIYAPGQYILSTFPIDICLEGNYGVDTESGDTYWACECKFEYDELSEDEGEWVHVSIHHINGYHFMSGSSMSTPHVSGVAALLLSVNPNLTAAQIESCIMNGADTITITTGDGEDQSVKRLNAWGAFKYLMDNYPIYERSIGYDDCTGSYYVDADAPYMKDNTMMVKYNIQNPGSYTFILSSNSPIEVKLYNSNLEEIVTTQTIVNNGCEIEFTYTLSTSTYYIKTNYINDSVEGTINIEIDCPPHTHEYIGWTYYSPTQHIECCECGQKGIKKGSHVVQAGSVVNYKGICMYCRATVFLLDDYFPGLMSVTKYSINGSYILPNGIIVLVDEDIEAYENGTLVFYDKGNVPQLQ